LVLTSIALVAGHRRASAQASHFATITGKGYRPRLMALGKRRYPALAFYLLFFFLTIGAPLFALIWRSLFRYHVDASFAALARAGLDNYRAVLNSRELGAVTLNTVWLSFGAASFTMLLALSASWVIVRGRGKGAAILDGVLFLPHALPGVVIGIAFIFLFVQPPLGYLNLYGTLSLMILALTVSYIPFASRTMNGALVQLHPELEEAAQVAGSSWLTILRRIILPLLLPSFVSGWIWIASHALRAFSLPLMLASRDSKVISLLMWRMWDDGSAGQCAALGVLLIVVLAVLTAAARWSVTRLNRQ
jgi:iron(III) transport system permease protein